MTSSSPLGIQHVGIVLTAPSIPARVTGVARALTQAWDVPLWLIVVTDLAGGDAHVRDAIDNASNHLGLSVPARVEAVTSPGLVGVEQLRWHQPDTLLCVQIDGPLLVDTARALCHGPAMVLAGQHCSPTGHVVLSETVLVGAPQHATRSPVVWQLDNVAPIGQRVAVEDWSPQAAAELAATLHPDAIILLDTTTAPDQTGGASYVAAFINQYPGPVVVPLSA